MALSAKIFRLKNYNPIDIIADKLSSYNVVEEYQGVELKRFFDNIKVIGILLKAYFIFDEPRVLNVGGETKILPIRREALVTFRDRDGEIILTVFEKKNRANRIANLISEVLFGHIGGVVEARINHEILKSIHESSPESTKVIYFDNIDIPNVNKLALYGDALADTSLYKMYLDHGLIWYVVFTHRETGYIVGLTRNLIVTMFSKMTLEEFSEFIDKYILTLF